MSKQIVKDQLYSKLEDSYELTAMFTDEELANMWLDSTSKEEVAKQYLLDNDWWEVLECEEPKEAYIDSNGNEVCLCEFER